MFEIDRTIITCLNLREKSLSVTYGWTDPNYRKATLLKMGMGRRGNEKRLKIYYHSSIFLSKKIEFQ